METVKQKATVRRVETVRPAAAPQLVQRRARGVVAPGIQASLRVSSPSDPAEREAVSTAQQVMRITIPDSSIAYVPTRSGGGVFRQLSETKKPLDREKEELERPSATGKGPKEIRRWTSPYAILRQPAPKKPLEEEKEKELKKPGMEAKEIRRWASPLALFRQAAKKPVEEEKEKELKKPGAEAKEIRRWESPHLARFAGALQRKKYEGQPDIGSNVAAEIQSAKTQGKPLPLAVRRFMEPRFRADFSNVRIHTDDRAAKLNQQVGARAFAVENQLFFGKDQFRPEGEKGRELIAHELTHTIQQGSAVQRSESVTVTQSAPVQVQRGIFEEALDFAAEKAESIPGFSMLTLVLGTNPITMKKVDRTAGAFFKAVVHLIPFGDKIHKALDEYGIFDKVAGFVQKQITKAVGAASAIYDAVVRFAKGVEATDLLSPTKTWNRAKAIFTDPIDQVKQTAEGLVDGILGFIKDAILKPLGALAQKIPHYDLLKAVMEKDPVTGDPYPRTPETVIGGFMKLAGQDDVWQKMQETKAVPKAWKWFQNAMKDLVGFVKEIPALFVKAFKSLEILDVILLPKAAAKVMGVFGGFAVRFISWAGTTVWNLLEIIFDVVKPGALGYVKRTGAAMKGILKNPAPFVGNLAKAAKLGFQNFAGGFLGHLKAGLIDWLTGSLPGVYIPKGFTLPEMVKFVFSILGISWAVIRAKLVKATSETAVQAMETGFDIVKTLVTQGPAAAWDKIKEQLANLKDQVVNGIIDLVVDAVVKKGVPKLVAMFIPGAGFISAIISIYDLVMTFVQKISKIMAVVTAFIDSIVAIAAGQIGAAAGRVEKILAGLLSLAISFIAGFAGLGKVADKIMGVINKVRGMIDKALDWLIGWIVGMAKKLFSKVFGKKGEKPDDRTDQQKLADLDKGIAEGQTLLQNKALSTKEVEKGLAAIKTKYRMTSLTLVSDGKTKVKESFHLHGAVNPEKDGSKVERELGDWPVKVGDTIKTKKISHRLEKVIAIDLVNHKITYTHKTAGNVTQPREFFLREWDAGEIYLSGELTAEEKRAELTRLYGAVVADKIMKRSELAANMGILDAAQAHHIIPVEIWGKSAITKKLIESGWDPNEEANGIALQEGFHQNHPAYNRYVAKKIQAWLESNGGLPLDEFVAPFKVYVKNDLIPALRALIKAAKAEYVKTGKTLNDFFAKL